MSASSRPLPKLQSKIEKYCRIAIAEFKNFRKDADPVELVWGKLVSAYFEGGLLSWRMRSNRSQDFKSDSDIPTLLLELENNANFVVGDQSDTRAFLSVLNQLWPETFAKLPDEGKRKIKSKLVPVNLAQCYFDYTLREDLKRSQFSSAARCVAMMPYTTSAEKYAILSFYTQPNCNRILNIEALRILKSMAANLTPDEIAANITPLCRNDFKLRDSWTQLGYSEELDYLCKLDPNGFVTHLNKHSKRAGLDSKLTVIRTLANTHKDIPEPHKTTLADSVVDHLLPAYKELQIRNNVGVRIPSLEPDYFGEMLTVCRLMSPAHVNDAKQKIMNYQSSHKTDGTYLSIKHSEQKHLFLNDNLVKYEFRNSLTAMWKEASEDEKKAWLTPSIHDERWMKRMSMVICDMKDTKEQQEIVSALAKQSHPYDCKLLGEIATHVPTLRTTIIQNLLNAKHSDNSSSSSSSSKVEPFNHDAIVALEKIPLDQDYSTVLEWLKTIPLDTVSNNDLHKLKKLILNLAQFTLMPDERNIIRNILVRVMKPTGTAEIPANDILFAVLRKEFYIGCCHVPWIAREYFDFLLPQLLQTTSQEKYRYYHFNDTILALRQLALVLTPTQRNTLLRDLLIMAEQSNRPPMSSSTSTRFDTNLLNHGGFLDLLNDLNPIHHARQSQAVQACTPSLMLRITDIVADYASELRMRNRA